MKKLWILLSAAALLAGCRHAGPQQATVKSVKADSVRVYGQSESVTFPGKIVAASDINLAFRVSGPIQRMRVDVGSYVRQGEVLAEIDPRDYQVQLAATEARYRQIESETARIVELYEKQSLPANDYEKAVYGLQQITAQYEAHKNALQDTRLLAPCDGYIQRRLFEAGETVSAGMPVLSMIGAGTGEVEINIPSSGYIRRERFGSYYCTVDVYPGKRFPLELIGITRKANMNQLYTMRFRLAGEDKQLPGPGMSTLVTIDYQPEESQTVSVPLTAVFQADGSPSVWVYNPGEGKVSSRSVQVSQILHDGRTVISAGLVPGEIVVTAGVHSLEEGEQVKLLPEASPTNVGGML